MNMTEKNPSDGLASPTLSMLEILQFLFICAVTLPHLISKISVLDITQAAFFDALAISVLVFTVIAFLTVKHRRFGSIYFRLDKVEYEKRVVSTQFCFSSFGMKEMATIRNVDLWYSTCLDITAQFILRFSYFIVFVARVKFSRSSSSDAPTSLFKEWEFDVNQTKNSYRRFILSKNIFLNAITIAMKHGIFRIFRS